MGEVGVGERERERERNRRREGLKGSQGNQDRSR